MAVSERQHLNEPPAQPGSLWQNRTFLANLGGYAISVTGDGFHSVALSLWVLQTTRSATAMALIMAAQITVGILLGAVAGTVCDHVDRRRLMIGTDLVRAALVLVMALLIRGSGASLGALIALKAAISVAAVFYNPALNASLVQIVGKDEVTRAGSMVQLARTLALVAGPLLGGTVVAVAGGAAAMLIDAATYLIGGVATYLGGRFPSPRLNRETHPSFWSAMVGGFAYMRERPFITSLAVMLPIFNLFANSAILLVPVIAITVWRATDIQFGFIQALFTAGVALGAVYLMLYGNRLRRRGYWMTGSWIAMGLLGAVIMIMPGVWPATPFIFVVGVTISLVNILLTSALQTEVAPEVQGRVMGTLSSLNDLATPIAMLVAGALADSLGPAVVGFALCMLCIIVSTVSLVAFPAIRRYT